MKRKSFQQFMIDRWKLYGIEDGLLPFQKNSMGKIFIYNDPKKSINCYIREMEENGASKTKIINWVVAWLNASLDE